MRRTIRPPDLTSLFDVLFILVFVSLVNAAINRKDAENARASITASKASASASSSTSPSTSAAPSSSTPAPLASVEALHSRAIDDLRARPALIARVSENGTLHMLELGTRRVELDVPLTEQVPDPDVAIAYLGDRSADLRICKIAALHLGLPDLAPYLVIISPDVPLRDLTVVLVAGMRRDVDRCLVNQRAVAVVVDPAADNERGATP